MEGQSKLFGFLFQERPNPKLRSGDWLATFKSSLLVYMNSIASRGSKYIYRQKMSLKHFENHLKKFKFTEPQIKKIKSLKKKFCKIFEDNIREIAMVNPNIPAGFKNVIGFSLEADAKQNSQSSSGQTNGNRSVIHKEFWERDMAAVIV